MKITVYDFLSLATEEDAEVEIFDFEGETTRILSISDAINKYGDLEIASFDSYISDNRLCLNIDTSEI